MGALRHTPAVMRLCTMCSGCAPPCTPPPQIFILPPCPLCRVQRGDHQQLVRGRVRDALEGKGCQRQPQKPVDRRLEEVAKVVGGGYCRLLMPLSLWHLLSRRRWLDASLGHVSA